MSVVRHHNEWLSLVPNSGPFLSLPVLVQAFPQGLDAHDADHARRLRMAFDEWDDDQLGNRPDPAVHRAWIKFVLGETLGYDELLAEGQAIPQTLKSEVAEYGETLRPDWIVNDPVTKTARLLVQVYPRWQSLTKPVASSRWKTSPDTRMMQLLHDTGIRLGIVTNGDHWMLVNAPRNETTGYASWYANLWLDESITLRAFRTLLGADRLFSVSENETLEALLDKSANDQQEVTDQLGYQVRKAVEVLIQALDKADQDHGRKLLADLNEKVLYESALTVMMRLVFLFCAEERELLLLGDDLYDRNYAVSTLREQLRVTADEHTEQLLEHRYDAWTRLLTTFRAVYAGAKHDRLRLPAYGGSLFNPDRFPFLEGRKFGSSWKDTEATPLPVSNRTVLHLLDALQILQVRLPSGGTAEARKLSFRSLDIEQIGHVYEGLLDHTAKRATEPVLGLHGTRDKEPEITLSELEKIAAKGEKELLKFLKEETGRSESAIKKGLNADLDDHLVSRFGTACQDSDIWQRVEPFAGLVRFDTVGYPVIITTGSVFITAGTDRRSSGTHYTPKSLTEPIVQYTLEPLVYVGPAEGLPKEQWKLRSARELLDLKICDMACGSGAFLVQACRYMAARLLEAWDQLERQAQPGRQQDFLHESGQDNSGAVRITPYGDPSKGGLFEQVVPLDPDERQTYALRIVTQRCMYGVDVNPLAVEMAKLSLWLLTLAKDKPFEFLDHAIRCGDSLVGIHTFGQLRRFNLAAVGDVELPTAQVDLQFMDQRLNDAVALRRQITEMQANTVENVEAQDRMLREANEKIDRLKYAADFLISAELVPGSVADKRVARDNAAIKVAVHFHDSDLLTFRQKAQKALVGQVPFHWPLEFPEVMVERGGFDAFVGNPPFMGGTKLEPAFGREWRELVVEHIGGRVRGRRGTADLCVYFILRSLCLLSSKGGLGLLATNTVAQGDSREVGLQAIADNYGLSVHRAISSRHWPGSATLEYAVVWMHFKWSGDVFLNDVLVQHINSHLDNDAPVTAIPYRLASNSDVASVGTKVYGEGFVLSYEERDELIKNDPESSKIIRPYMTGRDVNTDPEQRPSRWVIDFAGRSEEEAALYKACFAHVVQLVKPYRTQVKQAHRRQKWWQFGERREDLYESLQHNTRVLVTAETSSTQSPVFVAPGVVFAHKLIVFKNPEFWFFSALASSLHYHWIVTYGATLRTDPVYTPSNCFEPYPFPRSSNELERIGCQYHGFRHQTMLARKQGLTAIYNHFHDNHESSEDIRKLQTLHVEMDYAVATAYGWTDLDLGHGFHETKQGVRYTVSEPARREILTRLLKLNHERYAEEVKQGLHEKKKPKPKKGKVEGRTPLFQERGE
ncbi:MAG TPA: type IIL restriction-modification enzyme MmeI [Pirellulales bacterium]|jgi:hypothetical protein|nr:type IIL restriction-modification enzyme MmeI [Pirellulales bacterium]